MVFLILTVLILNWAAPWALWAGRLSLVFAGVVILLIASGAGMLALWAIGLCCAFCLITPAKKKER
jgi:hypothetical protein